MTGWRTILRAGAVAMVLHLQVETARAAGRASDWRSPFQAGKPDLVRDHLLPVPASRCPHADSYAKCTYSARVDFDRDGEIDIARMVEGQSVSAIIIEFAGKRKRMAYTIASFKGQWNGDCFIEAARQQHAVAMTCPEVSAAIFEMRSGKPRARWLGD